MEGSDTTVTMSPNESSNNLERIFSVDHAEDIAQPQCPGKGGTISNHEALGGATFSIHDVNAPTQSETVPLWPVNNDRGPLDSSLNAPPIAGLNENHPPGNTQFDEYLKQQSGLEDDYSLNSFSTQGGAATMNGDANAMSNEMTQPGSLNKNLPALSLDDSEYAEGSPQNITREEQVAQGEDEGRVHLAKNCANGETSSKRSHQPLEVIDLLDESDDDEASDDTATLIEQALPTKRPRFHKVAAPAEASSQLNAGVASSVALASYHARAANLPSWMDQHTGVATAIERVYQPEQPMSALMNSYYPAPTDTFQRPLPAPIDFRQNQVLNQPHYLSYPPNFKPTWALLVPPPPQKIAPLQQPAGAASLGQVKVYQLSLLNVNEFTIEGVSPRFGMPLTSISGLRVPIRQISRTHGKSVYQRDNDGGEGKWRIPLGAYHEFAGFLRSESNTQVLGIPPNQLQIASLERERQEKGYPTPDQLIDYGVPKGLANALAPFQRGGVDFVKEKGGRALIADGKLSLSWT